MPKMYYEAGQWLVPGHQSKRATRFDIPSTPFELANWLNLRNVSADPVETDHLDEEQFTEFVEAKPPINMATVAVEAIAAKVSQFKTNEIVEFVLEHASVMQVENILASLGTRIGELAKGTRK